MALPTSQGFVSAFARWASAAGVYLELTQNRAAQEEIRSAFEAAEHAGQVAGTQLWKSVEALR